jgi:two-component system sensor histidine kinase ResE
LFEDTEVQNIIHCAIGRVTDSALGKAISISKELPIIPIISKCDSERMIHALYQILHNAIRFTKHGGSIVLKLETTDTHISISVKDTGPGISAEDLPSLFKRFGKLYRPGEETHGTGVGLALAKHIVDQHNGDITVHSKVGEGSTFTIRIPILS